MGAVRVTSGRLIIGARALNILAADVATRLLWSVTVTQDSSDILNILMFSKIIILIGLVAASLLLFIVTTISPGEAGASGILMVFVLSYVVLLCGLTFVIWLLVSLVKRLGRSVRFFRNQSGISLVRAYYYSSVLSLGLIIVISLGSVGSIGVYEYCLVLLFVLLGCTYVARRTG